MSPIMRQKAYGARISGFDHSKYIDSNRTSANILHQIDEDDQAITRSKFGGYKQSLETEFLEDIHCIEGNKLDETITRIRGQCFLKQKNEEFRRHWLEMQGNELYFYSK